MDAGTIDALDNFINDAGDQAAAWYSILNDKPVVVPSAQITAQTAIANSGNAVVRTTADGQTFAPAATATDTLFGGLAMSPVVLVLALGVVVWLVVKG